MSSGKEEQDEDESERVQQQRSLLRDSKTKETRDMRTPIGSRLGNLEDSDAKSHDGSSVRITNLNRFDNEGGVVYTKRNSKKSKARARDCNRVYNIEFQFDTEVDCSIRIFYFCSRELTSDGITYKPQHSSYKSKTYFYKKGLGQKFEHREHTFQPHLFDEDLLIHKPLDADGNYNPGALFPIVIHCEAHHESQPRQSQSLVATVDKSQLDESYSIKPLKQLIFADGVQYILQDIYGIENKNFPKQRPLACTPGNRVARQKHGRSGKNNPDLTRNLNLGSHRSSMISIGSSNNLQQFSDTASIASGLIIDGCLPDEDDIDGRASVVSVATAANPQQQFRSLTSENNSFECVICMSEERDTMLLPCRHLCLCSSCAQSLRYQASSCPICRCPFKAALNLRISRFNQKKEARKRGDNQEHEKSEDVK